MTKKRKLSRIYESFVYRNLLILHENICIYQKNDLGFFANIIVFSKKEIGPSNKETKCEGSPVQPRRFPKLVVIAVFFQIKRWIVKNPWVERSFCGNVKKTYKKHICLKHMYFLIFSTQNCIIVVILKTTLGYNI